MEVIKRLKPPAIKIEVVIALEYFNTSSAKCLFDILKLMKDKQSQGMKVDITWRYEEDDLDMMETGEDYEDLLGLNFTYEAIQDSQYKNAISA